MNEILQDALIGNTLIRQDSQIPAAPLAETLGRRLVVTAVNEGGVQVVDPIIPAISDLDPLDSKTEPYRYWVSVEELQSEYDAMPEGFEQEGLLARLVVRALLERDVELPTEKYASSEMTRRRVWDKDGADYTSGDLKGAICPNCFVVYSGSGSCMCVD